jgi:hypothetical protein
VRRDPIGKREEFVAGLDAACEMGAVAWSPRRDQGLAVLQRDTPGGGTEPAIFRVTFAGQKVEKLSAPTPGEIGDFGWDAQGGLWVLTLQSFEGTPTELEFQGKKFPIREGLDGLPALAHAFGPAGEGWSVAATVVTSEGADYALGVHALEVSKGLGPRSKNALDAPTAGTPVEDAALVAKLAAAAPETASDEGGEWRRLPVSAGEAFVWMSSGEFLYPTGRVVFMKGGAAAPATDAALEPTDASSVMARGAFVLVTRPDGNRARLYDARTGALVTAVEDGTGVVFWPE